MERARNRSRTSSLVLALCLAAGCGAHTPLDTWDEADADEADADEADADEADACLGEEVCGNGLDDDCDGAIDDGCPQPCEPETCEDGVDNDCDGLVDENCGDCDCTPGTRRWCAPPLYSMVGSQPCADDGRWGVCREDVLVEACADVGSWYSPTYEACLIDVGECAQDTWDLDSDGDTWESLGGCPDVICPD